MAKSCTSHNLVIFLIFREGANPLYLYYSALSLLFQMTKQDVDAMSHRRAVYQTHTGTKKHFLTTFVTTFGLQKNTHQINSVDQEVTLDDLYH